MYIIQENNHFVHSKTEGSGSQSHNKLTRMASTEELKGFVSRIRNPELQSGGSKELNDIYDEWADKYDQMVFNSTDYENKGYTNVAKRMMELLGDHKEAKVMDLGAGTGQVGAMLYENGYRNLDALDASREMLEKAKQKGIYTRLICDFLGPNELDISAATYDGTILAGVFVPNHVNDSCFEEVIRIMKPGAYFVFNIREDYLEHPEFKDRFVPRIQALSERGLWEVVSCERREYGKFHNKDWIFCYVYTIKKQ